MSQLQTLRARELFIRRFQVASQRACTLRMLNLDPVTDFKREGGVSLAHPGCLEKGMRIEDDKPVKHLVPVADFEGEDGIC